ncbi:hypothetical protein [Streptomyces sp. GD-15H]|uniref:hypothetical protein n=1 Tax=Streptomyces sp. GD-15H TaxID=3129112 RepID=UPI003873275B
MDASGGRGQPRSGNDEPAERHVGAPAGAPPEDGGRFDPAGTTPSTPDDRHPSVPGDAPSRTGGTPAETEDTPVPADTGATPRSGEPARLPAQGIDAHPQNPRGSVGPDRAGEPGESSRPAEHRDPRTPNKGDFSGNETAEPPPPHRAPDPAAHAPSGGRTGAESDAPSDSREAGPAPDAPSADRSATDPWSKPPSPADDGRSEPPAPRLLRGTATGPRHPSPTAPTAPSPTPDPARRPHRVPRSSSAVGC